MTTLPQSPLAWSLLVTFAYLFAVAAAAIAAALRAGGRREETIAPDDARAVSRFTIPVSLVVAAADAGDDTSRTIASLLDLNYPELEVIVVVDGQHTRGLATLIEDWRLEAHEFFFRRSIETTPVRRMYRSGRDSRLTVIDQPATVRADAMNCGVNIARYRYVAVLSPGISFDRHALLRVMAAPLRDPSAIVGTSAHIERAGIFARLGSVRSLTASLLLWRHLPCAPPPADALIVWRRDALLDVAGFSTSTADPELDMAKRVLLDGKERKEGRFYRSGEPFGEWISTKSGAGIGARQLAALRFATALSPAGIRAFGAGSLAAFFGIELLMPLAQAWAIAGTALGAIVGAWSWWSWLAVIAMLSIGRAAVTTATLLTRGSALQPPEGSALKGLLAAAPFELLIARLLPIAWRF